MKAVLLYDGYCVLCNYAVKKILKWDSEGIYKLAALQSEAGSNLLLKHQLSKDIQSIVVEKEDEVFIESQAFLVILKDIRPHHIMRYILMLLPVSLADGFYRMVARKRYQWFGKYDSCQLLPDKERGRML